MKTLTKLALVSAVALSGHAMAMQSLDDEALSAATGQDGVTITLTGPISMDYLAIVDGDGVTGHGITTGTQGAIVVGNTATGGAPLVITPANGINVVIDADGNGTTPVLNINLDLGDTTISVGSIGVANTNATGSTLTNRVDVLDIGNITLNGLTTNIQLGSQPQGAMIKLNSSITGGLNISNLALKGGSGDISLGAVKITDAGGANLTLALDIDATTNGLEIRNLTPMDIAASSLKLGAAPALGAMYVSNLNVGTSVTIAGH